MIAYFDTSAIVPLVVSEPGSAVCRRVWDEASDVVSARIAYVEAAAALAQAERGGRIDSEIHDAALNQFEKYWESITVIEVGDRLVRDAAVQARRRELRAYDALHCAAALQLGASDCVMVAGDRALLSSWASLGLTTVDIN